MFSKRKKFDYKLGSLAREDFLTNVESVLKEKGIKYDKKQLFDLVDAYSSSDTETMSWIFIDIIKRI